MGDKPKGIPERVTAALICIIQLQLMLLAAFAAGVIAYIGVWLLLRCAAWVFEAYLRDPWVVSLGAMTIPPSFPMGGPFGSASVPERVIEQVERALMPSGRQIEIKHLIVTQQDGLGRFVTRDDAIAFTADCGDTIRSFEQLSECSGCSAIVCKMHSCTCSACGKPFCTACTTDAETPGERICENCARKAKKKARLRWLIGLIWEPPS